jgi:uncharacterized repeat protein (TIGR03803 family)
MDPFVKKAFACFALMSVLVLVLVNGANAQNVLVHSFTATAPYGTNADGVKPDGDLVSAGNILYGTASYGGANGVGVVFAVRCDGASFTNLHSFAAGTGDSFSVSNTDGAYPETGLTLSGGILYGVTSSGGTNSNGTIFAINTNGTGFTLLHTFDATRGPDSTNNDGSQSLGRLILSGSTLYGTALTGGTNGFGTLFAMNTNGASFTVLHAFAVETGPNYTNYEGANPASGLTLSGPTLYGTADFGGANGNGTLFAINTNGTGYDVLHTFNAFTGPNFTNGDGGLPIAPLISSGNTLYGTASGGGATGNGTVFSINTNGTVFTVLHNFTAPDPVHGTNSDGSDPWGGLLLVNHTLYGTTQAGGPNSYGRGTVFAVNTNGTDFSLLYGFSTTDFNTVTNNDGVDPLVGLTLSGNTLFGTAFYGGLNDSGTVFGVTLPAPRIGIICSGTNVILTWPGSFTSFTLQSATNLNAPNWNTIAGQNCVTNPMNGPLQIYRLIH